MKKELDSKKIIITLVGFIVLWTILTDAWGYSDYIFKGNSYHIGAYIYGYINRMIWVMPAICLIIQYNNHLKLQKKELFTRPKCNLSLIAILAISLAIIAIEMVVNHKGFWFNTEVNTGLVVIKYVIVGFVEEVVFRGWGYNSLAHILSHKKAAMISSLLFMGLHWPAYFIRFFRFGVFDFAGIMTQSVSTLIWGVLFCWLLKKGKTIWNPITVHIIYDLMWVLFVGGS